MSSLGASLSVARRFVLAALFAVPLELVGCRCESTGERRVRSAQNVERNDPGASTHSSLGGPSGLSGLDTSDDAEATTEVESTTSFPNGVAVPITWVRQLRSRNAEERSAPRPRRGVDPVAACVRGCALYDERNRLELVRVRFDEFAQLPVRIELLRLVGSTIERRDVPVDELASPSDGEDPELEWLGAIRQALGRGAYRAAPSVVGARTRALFAGEEYAPLVALTGTLRGRWLYAEVGRTAYRVHLLREDRSSARLVATSPLLATSCGTRHETACVAPLGIEDAVPTFDEGAALVLLDHVDGSPRFDPDDAVLVALDDASTRASLDDEDSDDLERSLHRGGPRVRWTREEESTCSPACVRFSADGRPWALAASRLSGARPVAWTLLRSGEPTVDPLTGDVAEAEIARVLAEAPRIMARRLVARQAIASWSGWAIVPLVELRPPHAGRRLETRLDGHDALVALDDVTARVEAPLVEGHPAPPSIMEAFAPEGAGWPLVVALAFPARRVVGIDGPEHTVRLVVLSPRRGFAASAPAPADP